MPALVALLARRSLPPSCMAASKSICAHLASKCSLSNRKQLCARSGLQRGAVLQRDWAGHACRHAWGPLRGQSFSARPSFAVPAAQTSSRMLHDEQLDDASRALALPDYCAGCGVKLQADDPDRPG